ncbi:hypothetical protein [Planomonospora parontospora]|uniref:hypothetical protein n=1 Tax=Planomonospora parontospora TaxID=58119 RepID=UPI00166FED46|nr:hypothetical protein [Planomonospora parontospora]GGL58031.1 hypothetical protein GCM10014719_69300 [Planomonospora parontospora subsp. antibiotica]GII19895.1 hypothetical protein Ppa05_66210 [Planomonospora parontospora subsp. antibiotica]
MGRMSRITLLGVAVTALALQIPSTATAGDGVSCHGKSPLRKLCDDGGPASGTGNGAAPASGTGNGGDGDDEPSSRSGDEVYDSSSVTAGPNGASN